MKILDRGREHIDIEIGERVYRLGGVLSNDSISILTKWISLVVEESTPMSEREKKEFLDGIDKSKSSNKEFVAWLSDPATVINTKLQDISEQERMYVIETVCEEWSDDKCPIYFTDDNYNLFRKSKTAK